MLGCNSRSVSSLRQIVLSTRSRKGGQLPAYLLHGNPVQSPGGGEEVALDDHINSAEAYTALPHGGDSVSSTASRSSGGGKAAATNAFLSGRHDSTSTMWALDHCGDYPLTPPPVRHTLLRELLPGLQGNGLPPRREVMAELRSRPIKFVDAGHCKSRASSRVAFPSINLCPRDVSIANHQQKPLLDLESAKDDDAPVANETRVVRKLTPSATLKNRDLGLRPITPRAAKDIAGISLRCAARSKRSKRKKSNTSG